MAAEYDRHQAAEALGISLAALRRRSEDPKCPLGEGERKGRRLFWTAEAVEAARKWEDERRQAREARRETAEDEPKAAQAAAPSAAKPTTAPAPKKAAAAKSAPAKAKASEKPAAKSAPKAAAKAPGKPVETTSVVAKRSIQPVKTADAPKPAAAEKVAEKTKTLASATTAPIDGVDPIALWLEACKNAVELFKNSCDPRRNLLLMNPFAPMAVYGPFAGMMAPGVWGAASETPAQSRAEGGAGPMNLPNRANKEARKLFDSARFSVAERRS